MEVRRLPPNELMHYGIEGQRWGIRRYQNEDGTLTLAGKRRYSKMAKKDAKEFARAKMFYGEGAGNRRKLIKATVNERSKNDFYKQEFERYSSQQDMSKHAKAAKSERKRKDTSAAVAKTARGVKNLALQTSGSVTVGALALYTGYKYYKKNPDIVKNIKRTVATNARVKRGKKIIEGMFKN